jgi:hypothetical protein
MAENLVSLARPGNACHEGTNYQSYYGTAYQYIENTGKIRLDPKFVSDILRAAEPGKVSA